MRIINNKSTVKSQLLVHPEGVRLMDFRSSIGVYDKSTPHGTALNTIVDGFSNALRSKLLASENATIKDNADTIINCLNAQTDCDPKFISTVKPEKETLEALLETTISDLNVGSKNKGDILRRFRQLFGN
jgi:hypothetical protein